MQQKKYRLLGYPLTFSLSPIIHGLFAKQCGIDISYELQEVTPANLLATITEFITAGGSGLNITAPHKEQVYQQLVNLYPNAKSAQAVNTVLVKPDGSIWGDNTDGIGLARDLQRHAISVRNQKILILGAGGAVRGILPSLLQLAPSSITIVNRNLIKAELLASNFATSTITVKPYAELHHIDADVVIHAINAQRDIKNLPKYKNINFKYTICYDLNYAINTPFTQNARAHGAINVLNGLGMLVEQAAAAFYLWHAQKPDTNMVLAQLQQNAV